MENNFIPSIVSKLNTMDSKLTSAGGYTYLNDRIPLNADEDHKKVLQTLIDLNIKHSDVDKKFNDFIGFTYPDDINNSSEAEKEEDRYNVGIAKINGLYNTISEKIDELNLKTDGEYNSTGRILIVDENVKIIYDSNATNNTYSDAKSNLINQSIIGYRSYYMAANMSETRIGHGIKRSGTSGEETVYVAHTLGPYGYNDLTVIYAVSWSPPKNLNGLPSFIKPWW